MLHAAHFINIAVTEISELFLFGFFFKAVSVCEIVSKAPGTLHATEKKMLLMIATSNLSMNDKAILGAIM